MNTDFDIAIVGSGFGGSLLAMIARRLGRSVVMLERGRHPRFAIGESSTPLANLLLEEVGQRYNLPNIGALTKWGPWQRTHPDITCGLKRGFTFYHHTFNQPWKDTPDRDNQLLVAASPQDEIADTHWYRPDFDHYLVQQAQQLGVGFIDEARLERVEFSASGAELFGDRAGKPIRLRVRFVVDATGPRGFLHRALALTEVPVESMPATQGLYTHFQGVRRWDTLHTFAEPPPYPVDDAAVHHVFDGGWMWVLRFNNGITSAGVATNEELANELRFADGAAAWKRLLDRLPSVREQFQHAMPRLPFVHAARLPFRSATVSGDRWALLPSAAGFVDPLLSTGFPLTLLGIERLARILENDWESSRLPGALHHYERQTLDELDAASALIGALYANLDDFKTFTALTHLYFAAAMYSETVRRLGQPERAASFLLHKHPQFGPALRDCVEQAHQTSSGQDTIRLHEAILRAIEPFNLAALGEAARRNWYPCQADDLLAAKAKVGATQEDIERLLARSGFAMATN